MVSALLMGILAFSCSYYLGRRKKVIDQLESDVRIFLTLILIASFYFRFFIVSILYLIAVLKEFELQYLVTSLYFLFPILLGLSLYMLTPWLCERNLHLTDMPVPGTVTEMGNLLGLSHIPRVRTTLLKIPPLVYGRRKKSSILVLPDHMKSFLTEKEQEAVIAHELSHIKQGDTGIITWLTYLLKGFKYWILPIPIFIYFGMTSSFFVSNNFISVILVLLFYVSVFLLKNSLSSVRESISDAYVVFHGYEEALKSALYKYAALKTNQKGCTLSMCFHCPAHNPLLAAHPPLKERLKTIEHKKFIVESAKNLPVGLAFWLGLVSAFLFYNGTYTIASLEVLRELFSPVPPSEDILNVVWAVPSIAVMGAVGISYLFPSTKGLVSFSDFRDSAFLLPFFRNWGITVLTAAVIVYGLTFDMGAVNILVPSLCIGFFIWLTGFSSTIYSDISEKMWSLPLFPFFPVIVLWYPVKIVYALWNADIDLEHFVPLMGLTIVVALVILLVLMETGHLDVGREQIIHFFGRRIEVHHTIPYGIIGNILLYCVPTFLSFVLYSLFCYIDTLKIFPGMILFFIVLVGLLPYALKKSDILFFTECSYVTDILQNNIGDKDIAFLQKVIQLYQNPDGGFNCAGLQFSTQKDTYIMVKTAHTIGMQLENGALEKWITSTEKDQGFALYPGGLSRVEGLYYAVKSLSILGYSGAVSPEHVHWVRKFFNGDYFIFENDTLSPLLQTCLAVEVLSFFNDLHDMGNCKTWIKNHFSEKLKPQEAFLVTRALIVLGSETTPAERWLKKNESVLSTRLDKNTEVIYYYIKVLRELNKEVPPLVVEEALNECNRIREKYKKKFGLT